MKCEIYNLQQTKKSLSFATNYKSLSKHVNNITDLILILYIKTSLIANPDFCSLKHTTDYKSLSKHVNDITDLILILNIIISLLTNPDFCSLKKRRTDYKSLS